MFYSLVFIRYNAGMKAMTLFLGAILITFLSRAGDIRTIGNKSVDLQPIHDWEEGDRKGERPLKHWKEIQILGWETQGPHGHPVATIQVSNAEPKQVWLKNCPKQIIQDFARVAELEKQQAAAQQQALVAAAQADAAKSQVRAYSVSGDPAFVNVVAAQEQAKANAAANATAAATYTAGAAEKISADLAQMRAKLAGENKVLAMDTGTIYSSAPIWDTGMVGR